MISYGSLKELSLFNLGFYVVKDLVGLFHGILIVNLEEKRVTHDLEGKMDLVNLAFSNIFFKNIMLRGATSKISTLNDALIRDTLTGIENRRALEEYVESLEKNGKEFSIIAFDIDSFKRINDEYGHSSGDDVLIYTAREFDRRCCECNSKAFRVGGDEFIGISVGDSDEVMREMENLRVDIESKEFVFSGESTGVTISMGIEFGVFNYKDGWEKADGKLYLSKETKNVITV